MVMIEGRDYTSQEAYFYNQGARGRDIALIHYQQRTGQTPSPELEERVYGGKGGTTPLTPVKQTQTVAVQSGVQPLKPLTPIEQQLMKTSPQLAGKLYEQRTKQTLQNVDLKNLISKPMPEGSYQEKPGGEIKIASSEQQARLLAEKQIKPTPYVEKWGYKPSDSEYSQEIADVSSQLNTQQQQLEQIQSAKTDATFTIGGKTYTKEQATAYFNKNIQDLTQSKAYLERYQEAGYVLKKTDTGYSFEYPKASDVVTKVYGSERPDIYVARELGSTLGFGTLITGAQQLITGQKSMEARKEQLAEQILGSTQKPGESIEAHAQRFWTSEEAIMDVYVPLLTIGASELVSVSGKTAIGVGKTLSSAVRFSETGQKIFGEGGQVIGNLIERLPQGAVETAKYVGFRAGFAGETVLYETGQLMAKPGMGVVTNVGLYSAMGAPQLVQVAKERPEMFGAVLGESLFKYEFGMGAMEYGFTQKPITTAYKTIMAREQPLLPTASFKEFLGAEEATQPLPGAKRFATKGMTPEESFAFTYKEPAQRITAEEREAEALARSMEKKKPGFKEFIRSEEGTQPILGGRNLIKSESTAQPLPGAKQYIPDTEAKQLLKPEGQTEYFVKEGKETIYTIKQQPTGASLIEETTPMKSYSLDVYPKPGGKLEVGEIRLQAEPLILPASYEQTITRVGKGTQKDVFSLKIGGEEAVGVSRKVMTGKPLDIIEATPSKGLQGELLIEEYPRKSTLVYAEFAPEKGQQFEGFMMPRRVTPVSTLPYPGEGAGNLYESMPGTKAEAIKSQELIYKPYDIGMKPKTQEESLARIQSYYETPSKTTETLALKIGGKTKAFTKEDIADFTGLIKPEPATKQGVYALDFKGEEKTFFGETPEPKKQYSFGKQKTYTLNVKGQTKTFTGEELLGLSKEGKQPRLSLSTRQAIEYSPPKLSARQTLPTELRQDWMQPRTQGTLEEYGLISGKLPGLESEVVTPKSHYGQTTKVSSGLEFTKTKGKPLDYYGVTTELPQGSPYQYFKPYKTPEPVPSMGRPMMPVVKEKNIIRPEEGWGKYLGERQEAKIVIEKTREYNLPQLESEASSKITTIPKSSKASRQFTAEDMIKKPRVETGARPENFLLRKPSKPFSIEGETIGRQSYIIERQGTKAFEPSGLYESPELNTGWSSIYAKQPSMKEIYGAEKGIQAQSSFWEKIRPGGKLTREPVSTEIYKTGMHLLSGGMEAKPEGEGLLTALSSTLLGKTKPGLIDQEGFGEITNRLTGLGELNEPMQGQPNINDFMNKLKYIDLTKQGSQGAQRQASLQATKQLTDQIQEQDIITDQGTIFDTGYDTTPDRFTDIFNPPEPGGDNIWRPPPPRKKKEEPEQPEYIREKMKEAVAYDVYVKERGMYHGKVTKPVKFIKVTSHPVSYEDALSLGGEITDTTSAVSFRVKQVKQRPTRLDRPVQSFTSRSYKFRKQGETFIEKSPYRMDTPGELQQVSALGQQERRKQGLMNKSSSIFSIRTPKSHATGLLSPMTKLKETRLFKKKNKKGERKNAYI